MSPMSVKEATNSITLPTSRYFSVPFSTSTSICSRYPPAISPKTTTINTASTTTPLKIEGGTVSTTPNFASTSSRNKNAPKETAAPMPTHRWNSTTMNKNIRNIFVFTILTLSTNALTEISAPTPTTSSKFYLN